MAKIDLKEILAGVAAGVVLPVITTLVTEGLENLQENSVFICVLSVTGA